MATGPCRVSLSRIFQVRVAKNTRQASFCSKNALLPTISYNYVYEIIIRLRVTRCAGTHRRYSLPAHPKVAFEVRPNGCVLSWGGVQYCTDSIGQQAQAQARSRRHHKTSGAPRMRRGDFDQTDRTYGRTRRRTPHVRMQAMPRATSIHRRSRE
jgi:hypothetical protein